jgi:hypothetical protein
MNRRSWLGLGLAGSTLLAGGGVAAWLADAGPVWRDGRLLGNGRGVLRAVARGVLDGTLPHEPEPLDRALDAHLQRLEATVASLAPAAQAEFGELLTLLATTPGRRLFAVLEVPWHAASVAQLQAMLQGLRESRLMLRRAAYHALRDLTHAAYFADERTWPQLGYPGPRALA